MPPCLMCQCAARTGVIRHSSAQTMMGLEKELKEAAAALQRCVVGQGCIHGREWRGRRGNEGRACSSVRAGCVLIIRCAPRPSLPAPHADTHHHLDRNASTYQQLPPPHAPTHRQLLPQPTPTQPPAGAMPQRSASRQAVSSSCVTPRAPAPWRWRTLKRLRRGSLRWVTTH